MGPQGPFESGFKKHALTKKRVSTVHRFTVTPPKIKNGTQLLPNPHHTCTHGSHSNCRLVQEEEMNVPEQFFIMRNATFGLSEPNRVIAFNGLCHVLHEQWSIPKHVLARHMEEYGFEYTVPCSECDKEIPWDETCSGCNGLRHLVFNLPPEYS